MITLNDGVYIGYLVKPHGFKGWLKLAVEREDLLALIKEKEWVFVEIQKKPVPFFIENIKGMEDGRPVVKLKYCDSPEDAAKLAGKKIHLIESRIDQNEIEEIKDVFLLQDLVGWQLIDNSNQQEVGEIMEVIETDFQTLLVIEGPDESEILIPFHEDLLQAIDEDNNRIYLVIAAGLY